MTDQSPSPVSVWAYYHKFLVEFVLQLGYHSSIEVGVAMQIKFELASFGSSETCQKLELVTEMAAKLPKAVPLYRIGFATVANCIMQSVGYLPFGVDSRLLNF
jgi:hypothetical protein